MRIRYLVTRMDLLQGRMWAVYSSRLLRGFYLLLAVLVVFLSLHDKAVQEHGAAYQAVYVAIELFFILGGSLMILVIFSAIQAFTTNGKGLIGEHTLRLTDEGLEETTAYNTSLNRWTGYHRTKKRGSIYLLYITESSAHIVPTKRAPLEGDYASFFKKSLHDQVGLTNFQSQRLAAGLIADVRQKNPSMLIQHQEFTKLHPHCAMSVDGFRVEIQPIKHQVSYVEEKKEVGVEFEWITGPAGMVLHLDASHGFERFDRSRAYQVLAGISRGLKFLGFRTETDGELPHDRPKKDA